MQSTRRNDNLKKKGFKKRFLRVLSRHPSHNIIRKSVLVDGLTCIRLGSTSRSSCPQEINSIEAVINSSNKRLMKECFTRDSVKTAKWWSTAQEVNDSIDSDEDFSFPILSKLKTGSRARGLVKINNEEEWNEWVSSNNTSLFIFEKYYNYSREYRIHVYSDGYFYTCRKMLKRDSPDDARYFRNDSNCVWFLEDNEGFDKPVNWEEVVHHSVLALKSVGLDIGAVDLRIQSSTDPDGNKRDNPDFIVVEINSAPSFGDVTAKIYREKLPEIVKNKYGRN